MSEEAQGGLGGWVVADLSPGERKREPPPALTDATEIVRYVRLSTLFLYLSDRAFIPSLKCLRGMDKFEGEVGLEIPSNSKIRSFAKNLENEFAKHFGPCPPDPPDGPYRANINWRKELAKRRAIWCWNLFEGESNAMWQLYGSKGVQIKSTVGRLKKALANSGCIRCLWGPIRYGVPSDARNIEGRGGLRPAKQSNLAILADASVPIQATNLSVRTGNSLRFGYSAFSCESARNSSSLGCQDPY